LTRRFLTPSAWNEADKIFSKECDFNMARRSNKTKAENEVSEQKMDKVGNEADTIQMLTKQVEELQKQLQMLQVEQKGAHRTKKSAPDVEESEGYIDINGREYIKVMSLSNIPLNLTTEAKGQGRLFQFLHFGEQQRIMYEDLIKIMYNHRNFTESGRYIILDRRVVRTHGLDDAYTKILTKEKIETILENKQGAVDLYKSANDVQKKIIQEILVKRIKDHPASVDMNLVMHIRQISGIDLVTAAETSKYYETLDRS
jgi:FtsZ-binding cell division protein ZapB